MEFFPKNLVMYQFAPEQVEHTHLAVFSGYLAHVRGRIRPKSNKQPIPLLILHGRCQKKLLSGASVAQL